MLCNGSLLGHQSTDGIEAGDPFDRAMPDRAYTRSGIASNQSPPQDAQKPCNFISSQSCPRLLKPDSSTVSGRSFIPQVGWTIVLSLARATPVPRARPVAATSRKPTTPLVGMEASDGVVLGRLKFVDMCFLLDLVFCLRSSPEASDTPNLGKPFTPCMIGG